MGPRTTPVRSEGTRVQLRVLVAVVVGVLALPVGFVVVGDVLQEPSREPRSRRAAPSAGFSTGADDRETDSAGPTVRSGDSGRVDVGLGWSPPLRLSVPGIGVSTTLERLGLDAAGVMETPRDPDRAGWFTPNPPPGLSGTAVIAGHVTWDGAPSVFYDLARLRRGDRVAVRRADGITAVFAVQRVARFPKSRFPTRQVYGQVPYPALRLITCGGAFDETTRHYLDNVIVWARMVASHTTRG